MRDAVVRMSRLWVVLGVVAAVGTAVPGPSNAADTAAKKAPATKAASKKAAPKKAAAKKPVEAKEALKEMVEGEDVRDFRTFCDTWMKKLHDRNTYNDAHIAWTKGGPGVYGEYVNYGTDRTCVAREEPGKVPIGKITYREIKYRREGANEAAAQAATGTIVEQTDVTEIFRWAKGAWQY